MFDSQVSLVIDHKAWKRKRVNIQEFRPGRSAMQWHCGLCLFFKNIYPTEKGTHGWLLVTMRLIKIVVVWFDTCVCTLIFETNNAISAKSVVLYFDYWEDYVVEILNVPRSVRKTYLLLSCPVYKIDCSGARHIPSRHAIVCDCHWEYPPGCVWEI